MQERSRLMDHVMVVDQHVRYALILQFGSGLALSSLHGFIPGGHPVLLSIAVFTLLWLVFIETVHRNRDNNTGRYLARIDRVMRYVLLLALLVIASGFIADTGELPYWYRWKLALFAGVVLCGLGIRLVLISQFRIWTLMKNDGVNDERDLYIRQCYIRATAILLLLWLFIIMITSLSVIKV